MNGSVIENETDLFINGPLGGWRHQRSYNSMLDTRTYNNPNYNIQGRRWTGGAQAIYLRQHSENDTMELFLTATSRYVFKDNNPGKVNGTYTGPDEFNATLTKSVALSYLVYTLTFPNSGEVYIFKEKDPMDPCWGITGAQSDIIPLVERTNLTYLTQGLIGETYSYDNNQKLALVVTASPQSYFIKYTYYATGGASGCLKKIEVFDGSPSDLDGKIAEAEYLYADGQIMSNYYNDVEALGDLVQVRVSELLTDGVTWDHKYTQYRYYLNYIPDGFYQLESVLEPEAIERIMAENSEITKPEDLFNYNTDHVLSGSKKTISDYSARSFTYFETAGDMAMSIYGGKARDVVPTHPHLSFVQSEMVNTGCTSCGGSTNSGLILNYYYMTLNNEKIPDEGEQGDPNIVVYLTVEDTKTASEIFVKRTVYAMNWQGVELRRAVIENPNVAKLNVVCTSKILNANGMVVENRSADAHALVTNSSALTQFLNPYNGSNWTNDQATLEQSKGMISITEYDATVKKPSGFKVKIGSSGPAYYVNATDYNAQGHVLAQYAYPTQTTDRDDDLNRVKTTSFMYISLWEDNFKKAIKTEMVLTALVPTSQNGPNLAAYTQNYYDSYGKLRWTRDPLGVVTYYGYHPTTMQLTLNVRDVNTSSLPSSITTDTDDIAAWTGAAPFQRASSGLDTALNQTSTTGYDKRGRAYVQTGPDGVANYIVHDAKKSMQFSAWDSTTNKPLLPISVTETNAAGNVIASYQLPPTAVTVKNGKPTGVNPAAVKNTLTRYNYNVRGRLESVDKYHTIPMSGLGTLGTHYYQTVSFYDTQGREAATAQYVASNKWQVSAVRFDWRGRTIESLMGVATTLPVNYTAICSTNGVFASYLKTVAKSEFDASGKLIRALRYHGANDYTGTRYHYDNWNRTRSAVGFSVNGTTEVPFGPYLVNDYDWSGRVIASASFENVPTWSTVVANVDYAANTTTSRKTLTKNLYDTRGNMYREEVYQITSTGTMGTAMTVNHYYDKLGRRVASQQTAGLGTETAYDALGRAYQTRSVKALAATKYSSGNYQYIAPVPKSVLSSMTGGAAGVLAINHAEYYDTTGNEIKRFTLDLNAGDTTGINLSTNNYVRRSLYSWYDTAGRLTTQADYGSGAATWVYAAAPTRPTSAPTAFNAVNCLVTCLSYNSTTGRLETTIDPKGTQNKTFVNALGQTLFTVQNFMSFVNLTSSGNVAADKDVATAYTYNGLGNIETLTAVNSTTGNQTTKYFYEDLVNAALETSVIYPDSNDTDSSPSSTDQVKTTWCLDGNVKTRTDQNGTTHTYLYDVQRRETTDEVTTLGSGVDGTVRKITRIYNSFGALETISSWNASNAVVNQNHYVYDTNQRLARIYSNPSGVVNTSSTPYIEYTYDAAKNLRTMSMKYPSGVTVNYSYGISGSIDDLASRPVTVSNSNTGTTFVSYQYTGSSQPMQTTYNQPGLSLDYASGGLDRYGRISNHAWKKGATDVVRIQHGYDYNSNRTYRNDTAALASGKNFDELYAYDGINQLTDMQRGQLDAAKTAIASGKKNYQDNFTFDKTGNWYTYKQDTTGAGFSLTQGRSHSKANEILVVGGATTHVGNDANGNMTKVVKPDNWGANFTLVYDAWNRLVQVKDGVTVVATYQYNGLNHRVKKVASDVTRYFYFNEQWQCLEERVGAATTADALYIWGLRYIDDLVMYRKGSTDYYSIADPNWNVVALTNTFGVVQERYTYSAFGKVNFFDAAFAVRSTSSCNVTRTFTGQVIDAETGLMLYRNRVYHPTLGRFLQRDPIGYKGRDVNLYRYVGNAPQISYDSFGLACCSRSPNKSCCSKSGFDQLFSVMGYKDVYACANDVLKDVWWMDVINGNTVGAGAGAGGVLVGGGLGAGLGLAPPVGFAGGYQYAMRICMAWICKNPTPAPCSCISDGWVYDTWKCDCGPNGVIMNGGFDRYTNFPGNGPNDGNYWRSRWW